MPSTDDVPFSDADPPSANPRPSPDPARGPWPGRLALAAVLLVAVGLRVAVMPRHDEVREVDELAYVCCGPVLAEGMTPGGKASPAGPLTREAWLYTFVQAGRHLLFDPEVRAAPAQLRPYVAMDNAQFDLYADLNGLHRFCAWAQLPFAAWAVWAAFRLGRYHGGPCVAILTGGLVACLPLLVSHAGASLPYADAWSFAVLALAAAATGDGRRRWLGAGIFYGLALSARVDMVLLAPLLVWELWARRDAVRLPRALVGAIIASIVTLLVVSPWALNNAVGNLRTIVTTRISTVGLPNHPKLWMAGQVLWAQGLGPVVALLLLTPLGLPHGQRGKYGVLLAYLALLAGSMFVGSNYLLRYNGAAMLALAVYAAVPAALLARRWPRWAPAAVAACLILPVAQSLLMVRALRAHYVPEQATAWVERHVPAGARVYVTLPEYMVRTPLPTSDAADRIWRDVNDDPAWRRKLARGLERFGLQSDRLPRALSEENLILERSNSRRWFVQGGRPGVNRPRYDLRVAWVSPAFSVQDVPAEFAKTGGVVIWTKAGEPPPPSLGAPIVRFTDGGAPQDTYVFCSPDVRARLTE